MKRDRDGNQTSTGAAANEESVSVTNVLTADCVPPPPPPRPNSVPPPPPPRRAVSVPPPPPPRPPRSNGTAVASNGVNVCSDGAKKARVDPAPAAGSAGFPGGVPSSASSKRAKVGLDPPKGWRAVADEILLKAKEGEGGGGGSGENGVPARGESSEGKGNKQVGLPSPSRRKFAAVCSANFNRSMMAHKLLQGHRFRVESYGTGRWEVCLTVVTCCPEGLGGGGGGVLHGRGRFPTW